MSQPASPGSARCLTDAEIALVQAAPPGNVPVNLAAHLASCARCQQRALFGETPRRPGRKGVPRRPPSFRRTLFLALLVLAAMAAFFWSLAHMTGQVR
jgi:hypothetical protein